VSGFSIISDLFASVSVPGLARLHAGPHAFIRMSGRIGEAVITGGSGGIGTALAEILRADAWKVHAPGRAELDVTNQQSVDECFRHRRPTLVVCAAGMTRDAPLGKLSSRDWEETWQVNYQGALACAQAALPGMIATGEGHVVFLSSHSALHPPPGQAAYAAAKAALLGLTVELARLHGPANIRVNAILPGFLETRMTAGVTPKRLAAVREEHALGRFNTCREVAAFIRFLHLELPHTSGQVFQLDSRPPLQ